MNVLNNIFSNPALKYLKIGDTWQCNDFYETPEGIEVIGTTSIFKPGTPITRAQLRYNPRRYLGRPKLAPACEFNSYIEWREYIDKEDKKEARIENIRKLIQITRKTASFCFCLLTFAASCGFFFYSIILLCL